MDTAFISIYETAMIIDTTKITLTRYSIYDGSYLTLCIIAEYISV